MNAVLRNLKITGKNLLKIHSFLMRWILKIIVCRVTEKLLNIITKNRKHAENSQFYPMLTYTISRRNLP